jgi:hypothetical protein
LTGPAPTGMTPVFASKSNHAYDVADFTHVDPAFGGDAGLATLLSQAHRLGIRVILDLPFDPSSSDSPYFDRYHHYPVTGACEDPKSPYRSWFTFHNLPAGTAGPCAGEQPGGYATYDGWGGAVDTLPLFRKKDRSDPVEVFSPIADYFYRGQDSIAQTVARVRGRRLPTGLDAGRVVPAGLLAAVPHRGQGGETGRAAGGGRLAVRRQPEAHQW